MVLRKRHFLQAVTMFFLYCLGIEIFALNLDWWSFDPERVIGLYVWLIPIEELALFPIFSILTLAAWSALSHDSD